MSMFKIILAWTRIRHLKKLFLITLLSCILLHVLCVVPFYPNQLISGDRSVDVVLGDYSCTKSCSDRNRNASQVVVADHVDCLFTNYDYDAAKSIKSNVQSRLSLTRTIQIYKPDNIPFFYEDYYIRLKSNRTKLKHTKIMNHRVTEILKLTNGIDISNKRTCAVVGNGGILLNSACGSEIDAHNFVIRSNLAPLKQYVNDVGSKTSIMTINAELLRILVNSLMKNGTDKLRVEYFNRLRFLNNSVLWFTKRDVERIRSLHSILKEHQIQARLAYSPKMMMGDVRRIWNIKFPTTGLLLYTFAAALCDKISLYGFYPFSRGPNQDWMQHHYYETLKFNYKTESNHSFIYEYQLLTNLHRKGALRFVGDKCIDDCN